MVALFRRYLIVKVSFIVLAAVVLGFSVSAVVSAQMQLRTMDRLHRTSASLLAKGIAAGVRSAMLTGNGMAVRKLLEDTKKHIEHADVKVFTSHGEEVFGPRLPPPKVSDIDPIVHKTITTARFHMDKKGRSHYSIENEKRCYSCHDDGQSRGVLRIKMEGARVALDGSESAQHAVASITREGFVQVMVSKQDDSLDDYFEQLAERTPGLESIAVYDTEGEVFFGDQDMPLEEAEVARALQPGDPVLLEKEGTHFRIYPLENEPRCRGCHDDGEPMRGALAVGLSPENFESCHTVFQASATSLSHVMMSGLGRLGIDFLSHVADTGVAAELSLFDAEGRLIYEAFEEPVAPDRVREAMKQQVEVVHTVKGTDSEALVFIEPMLNDKQCQQCHGTETEVRGAISITLDTTEAAHDREALARQAITYAGGTVALVVLLLVFGLRLTVLNPVNTIGYAAERIGEGDLDVRVVVDGDDEMGRLGARINDMVSGLRQKLELSKFVSRATMNQVESSDGTVHREGERRELTVLFSDIRGFTAWSETREPEEVVAMLNAYLQVQSEVVIARGGDIDKFVGDELMARFSGPDHAARATHAAVEMVQAVAKLNVERALPTEDHIHVGVGVNTGEMVLGAMGSEQRMDFTVIGDEVNLGARLCSVAALDEVIVSEATAEASGRPAALRFSPLDPVSVKGKSDKIHIYDVRRSNS